MKTLSVAWRAVIYGSVFVSCFGWIAWRVRAFDRFLNLKLPEGGRFLGVGLMVGGGLLGLACVVSFVVRGQGTPAAFDAPKQFVATGPYRHVRNPMYIGGLVLLAGFGLLNRSVSILIMALGLLVLVHLIVVLYEEPTLRRSFGKSYEEYCAATRRWIPKWKDLNL